MPATAAALNFSVTDSSLIILIFKQNEIKLDIYFVLHSWSYRIQYGRFIVRRRRMFMLI